MINKRLSDRSSKHKDDEKAKPLYKTALNKREYKTTMRYKKTTTNKRNSAPNIKWFRKSYTQNVKTNNLLTNIPQVSKREFS